MFFTAKKEQMIDTYAKMKEILYALLLQECPDHRSQHHILYTANVKLAQIGEAKEHFRALINPATASGTYAQAAYNKVFHQYNELSALINSYMYICDETARERYNHNLTFSTHAIDNCYKLLKERKAYEHLVPIDNDLWTALKEEIIPIASKICA